MPNQNLRSVISQKWISLIASSLSFLVVFCKITPNNMYVYLDYASD